VLIPALAHGGRDQLRQPRIDFVIGKALADVDGAQLAGATRHHREDGRTDIGELAAEVWGHAFEHRESRNSDYRPAVATRHGAHAPTRSWSANPRVSTPPEPRRARPPVPRTAPGAPPPALAGARRTRRTAR